MPLPLVVLLLVTALGSALVAGVFFAFSGFVMPALRALPAADGAAAMRAINVSAVRAPLMLAIFGTAICAVGCAVWCVIAGVAVPWAVAAAALYLIGVVGLTAFYHVPRNDTLARLGDSAEAEHYWPRYVREWTGWNHLRSLAGALSAAGFLIGALG